MTFLILRDLLENEYLLTVCHEIDQMECNESVAQILS